ncbi:hypothetical protein HPB50_026476 [Hyalomma asiaticum]|uniref:Uncharacterized protein n=1 Tax=Hyalomma asiaticum TaxID=266040 RepID=A0ACB7T039_HYAAI|nr:hypothetical protein HPB50_026476 [Hyalomma asiaticum]
MTFERLAEFSVRTSDCSSTAQVSIAVGWTPQEPEQFSRLEDTVDKHTPTIEQLSLSDNNIKGQSLAPAKFVFRGPNSHFRSPSREADERVCCWYHRRLHEQATHCTQTCS